MRIFPAFSVIAGFALSAAPTIACTGGSCGGGGNTFLSSEAQVREAVLALKKDQGPAAHAAPATLSAYWLVSQMADDNLLNLNTLNETIQYRNTREAEPANQLNAALVAEAIRGFRDSPQAKFSGANSDQKLIQFLQELRDFKPEFRDKCYEGREEKTASTKFHRNAPVCFSLSKLRKLPPEALNAELVPLLVHEITHHFGVRESAARELQKYTKLSMQDARSIGYMNQIFVGGAFVVKNSAGGYEVPVHVKCKSFKEMGDAPLDSAGRAIVMHIYPGGTSSIHAQGIGTIGIGCLDRRPMDCRIIASLNGRFTLVKGENYMEFPTLGEARAQMGSLRSRGICATTETKEQPDEEIEERRSAAPAL